MDGRRFPHRVVHACGDDEVAAGRGVVRNGFRLVTSRRKIQKSDPVGRVGADMQVSGVHGRADALYEYVRVYARPRGYVDAREGWERERVAARVCAGAVGGVAPRRPRAGADDRTVNARYRPQRRFAAGRGRLDRRGGNSEDEPPRRTRPPLAYLGDVSPRVQKTAYARAPPVPVAEVRLDAAAAERHVRGSQNHCRVNVRSRRVQRDERPLGEREFVEFGLYGKTRPYESEPP